MKKKVLAVVFTPLQYMNAKSFLNNNECSDDSLILILASDQENVVPITEILEGNYKFPFKHLTFLPFNLTMIFKAIFIRFFVFNEDYEQLVIGNYNNIIAYFTGCLFYKKNKKVYLIDDGFVTVIVFHNRNIKKILNYNLDRGKFIKIIAFLLNIKSIVLLPKLTFYTYFKLDTGSNIDSVIRARLDDDFDHIKSKQKTPLCYFIGAPYVEKGIITLAVFKKIMKQIKEKYAQNGIALKYCLHRFEDEKPIGLEQIRFDKNIEIIFEKELQYLPNHLCAFYSTALFNLSHLYPKINCAYYDITDKVKALDRKKEIELIYRYLEEDDFVSELKI